MLDVSGRLRLDYSVGRAVSNLAIFIERIVLFDVIENFPADEAVNHFSCTVKFLSIFAGSLDVIKLRQDFEILGRPSGSFAPFVSTEESANDVVLVAERLQTVLQLLCKPIHGVKDSGNTDTLVSLSFGL